MADRKRRRFVQLAMAALVCCGELVATAASAAPFDAEVLMNWAERTWPDLFPGPQPTVASSPFVYRCYSNGNCAGVADGTVYIYGPVAGGGLQAVGPMAHFECQVVPVNCVGAVLPRLWAGDDVVVARDSNGRHLGWGPKSYYLETLGATPVPGTGTRLISTSARQVIPLFRGGATLNADGTATIWGQSVVNAPPDAPVAMPLQGRIRQLVALGLDSVIALLDDGTAWAYPGVISPRREPTRMGTPPGGASAVASGSSFRFYFVTSGGDIWVYQATQDPPGTGVPAPNVSGVLSVSCGSSDCIGVRRDGTVLRWDQVSDQPRALAGLTDIAQMSLGGSGGTGSGKLATQAAVSSSGQLWVWRRSDAPEAEPGFTDVTDVSCAAYYCVIRRADGSVWGWGLAHLSRVRDLLGPNASDVQVTRVPDVLVP